jgi:MFS family permease
MRRGARDATGDGRTFAYPRWLSHNLLVLCGVSFLQDAASELLYPILPIFLTVTLGAPVAVVGVVEGAAEAVAAVVKVLAGRVADRRRPRPLVALGYGCAAAGKAVIAFAGAWPVVLAGRGVDRVGKGIRGAPRDVLLVEGVPPEARGRAFGLHRAADTAGAVVGPLLGLALYEAFNHRIRPVLVLAVVPAVASVALVAAVRDRPAPDTAPAGAGRGDANVPRAVRRVVLVVGLFSLANFPDALLLLRVKALGLGVAGVIGAYVTYNVSYAVLSYPAGAFADRFRPAVVYAVGLCCFAVAYLGLGIVTTTTLVYPLFLVYGGFTACTDGVGKAWISALTPARAQGRAQGLLQGVTGGGVLIAGIWAGFAWHGTGRGPLVVSGTVALLTVCVLLVEARRSSPTGA